MHWIIQNNIFNEKGVLRLFEVLSRERYTFSVHRVVPFVGEIEPDINPEGKVICIGSYSMRHLAKKKEWVPGVFNLDGITHEMQVKAWGRNFLNCDAKVSTLRDAEPISDPFFIRPEGDNKAFAGTVMKKSEFLSWKIQVAHNDASEDLIFDRPADDRKIFGNTMVVMNRVIPIYREYRFWIVNGEIVTYSLYKIGDTITYREEADPETIEFVEFRIKQFQPHDAFVIDVALTEEGYKVLEINTLNSSGFYACDIEKLVYALGNM